MFGKVEAAFLAASSYVSALFISLQASGEAPISAALEITEADLFWPSFAGAGVAGLFTLLPMFQEGNSETNVLVAMRAALTIVAGFSFAHFSGVTLHEHITLKFMSGAELSFTLFVCGVMGEKFVQLALATKPQDWLSLFRWFASLRPGGGK